MEEHRRRTRLKEKARGRSRTAALRGPLLSRGARSFRHRRRLRADLSGSLACLCASLFAHSVCLCICPLCVCVVAASACLTVHCRCGAVAVRGRCAVSRARQGDGLQDHPPGAHTPRFCVRVSALQLLTARAPPPAQVNVLSAAVERLRLFREKIAVRTALLAVLSLPFASCFCLLMARRPPMD